MLPFVNLKPYTDRVRGSDFDLNDVFHDCKFLNSPVIQKFETALATKLGAQHAIACSSGTAALRLALAAHGVDTTFTVALPNVTFWATWETIVHTGATPLLVDIDPDDLQMSFDQFVQAHDRYRFRAAVLPHLFGWCTQRLHDFRTFCQDRGIALIEDGAQAFGVRTAEDTSVFEDAETITLSFFPAKVIGGITDGGAVLTKRARTTDTVRLLANHGRIGHYDHALAGFNARMNTINAAWLLRALDHTDHVIQKRRELSGFYENLRHAENSPYLTTRAFGFAGGNSYLHVITCPVNAEPLVAKLAAQGVGCGRVYPKPISAQLGADHGLRFGDLEHSYDFCQRVLNLPLWYGMKGSDVYDSVNTLDKALR